jgi:hypothetical protein
MQSVHIPNVQHILTSFFRRRYGMMRKGCVRQLNPGPGFPIQWHECLKWHGKNFPLDTFTVVQEHFYSFARPPSLFCEKYVRVYIHTYIWLCRYCIWITIASKLYYEWNIFKKIGRVGKCSLDICHWGDVLPVTERISANGQNISLSSCQTGRNSSTSYIQIFFLTTFIQEDSIINII